jgi:hypothetical protein
MSVSAEQLASHFVRRDSDLKRHTKELAPVRKERKEAHDHLMQMLTSDTARDHIQLSDGTIVRLKTTETPAPIKQEYVAEQLSSLLGIATAQAEEVARRIWEDRPKVPRHKVIYEGTAGAASGAAAGSAPRGHKRSRE